MKIEHNVLSIGGLQITFHRTLRLPEDGKTHALPPSLGRFPLRRVDDYADKVPAAWKEHGGIFFPLYQREAMWLGFHIHGVPQAVKVAAGKVNAVSGTPWSETLTKLDRKTSDDPDQDYLICPPQPWLDGFNVGAGVIRQFVAMPLGMKYTVEAQVTGEERFGGLQVLVIAPKKGGKADTPLAGPRNLTKGGDAVFKTSAMSFGGGGVYASAAPMDVMPCVGSPDVLGTPIGETFDAAPTRSVHTNSVRKRSAEMGLAQGGQMRQKIYEDPYGADEWDASSGERCFVHIVNSELWKEITGEDAPATPISAQTYAAHGYPWFDLYDEHVAAVHGSSTLANVKPVSAKDKEHGFEGQQDDTPIAEKNVIKHKVDAPDKETVRDGKW